MSGETGENRDNYAGKAGGKKNGSRSPNKFGSRLPLHLIWDAVLLRFQRPLFRCPVSGPISLIVFGFPHHRLRNVVSV